MILARVLQGMASGLIQPVAMVVLSEVFPRQQRGWAMGIFGIGVVLSPAVGPVLGGFLVDEYSWRYVFLAMVPVCVVAMAAAAVFLPGRDRARRARSPVRRAWASFFSRRLPGVPADRARPTGSADGWDSDLILALFAGAVAAAAGFIAWELSCRIAAAEPARVRQRRLLGLLPGVVHLRGGDLRLDLYRADVRRSSCRATRRPAAACC